MPPFSRRFVLVNRGGDNRTVASIDADDVVTLHDSPTVVDEAILAYCNRELAGKEAYRWTARQVGECRTYWLLHTEVLTEPVAWVRWQNEPGLTYRRLPWEYGAGASPLGREFLGRCTNAAALARWVGSLFFPEADRQQYVWMHGKGKEGKSEFVNFLANVFGTCGSAQNAPNDGNQFWSQGLLGKRFVYFADFSRYKFPASGDFKTLTGGDRIRIEPKGKPSYTAELEAKFIFLSQERPDLSSERSDTRRIIYCEVQPIPCAVDPAYGAKLWEEGGRFLSNCIEAYLAHHGRHGGPIVTETEQIEGWVEDLEQHFRTFFDENFVFDSPKEHDNHQPKRRAQWATPSEFQKRVAWGFRTKQERYDFIAWFDRTYPVASKKRTLRWTDAEEAQYGVKNFEKRLPHLVPQENRKFDQDTKPRDYAPPSGQPWTRVAKPVD